MVTISEERVVESLSGRDSVFREILEHLIKEIHKVFPIFYIIKLFSKINFAVVPELFEHLWVERNFLGELVQLVLGRGPQHLKYGEQLIPLGFSLKKRLARDQLGENATNGFFEIILIILVKKLKKKL